MHEPSSLGLSPRLAAALAYGGWWMSGALMWWVERRDLYVRFHAAQSLMAFGLLAVVIATLGMLAIVSLQLAPRAFQPLMLLTGATAVAAVLLWALAVWCAATGARWHRPIIGGYAERLARVGADRRE